MIGFVAVLEIPPVDSALTAVRVSVVKEIRKRQRQSSEVFAVYASGQAKDGVFLDTPEVKTKFFFVAPHFDCLGVDIHTNGGIPIFRNFLPSTVNGFDVSLKRVGVFSIRWGNHT
jgi:hypothetical protein